MKYYTFDTYKAKIKARQWDITIDGKKQYEWIFVNTYGSQPIMPDFVPFLMDYDNGNNLFFVSPKLKEILCRFDLPFCEFTPISFYWEDKIRKKYNTNDPYLYYMLSIDPKSVQSLWDFDKSRFVYLGQDKAWSYDLDVLRQQKTFAVENYDKYYAMWLDEKLRKRDKYLTPAKICFRGEYDAALIQHNQFIFNEHIKKAMEWFKVELIIPHSNSNPYLLLEHIEIAAADTPAHQEKSLQIIEDLKALTFDTDNQALQAKLQAEIDKRDRLLSSKGLVAAHYQGNKPVKNADLVNKEIELDVVFPANYEAILSGETILHLPEGYQLLSLNEVISLGTNPDYWQDFTPYAVKSVAIAHNGIGDYIGYILKAESDIQLDDVLYEFMHESGTVEELN
jgi:hypothetical protein